jgi:hypothetical protein
MNKETIEEAAKRLYEYQSQNPPYTIITPKAKIEGFIEGAKWKEERSYSEEEVLDLLPKFAVYTLVNADEDSRLSLDKWFEQFKKK